ncbi:MAG: tripartite tricarboxylate transporter TctB family protein [Burkholderiaceae bacterium]|nr:tripartite tricarboxylate transporter TctB family protein [Burkholderiaceae bacterium]
MVAARMPATGGFSGVGPAAMPSIVATGLIIVGLWLTAERLTGGWRQAEGAPESRGEHAFFAPGFVWISAGLIAQMALIHTAGFVARLRQREAAARCRHRRGDVARHLRLLRALPERQPAGRVAQARARRGGDLRQCSPASVIAAR